MKYRTLILMLSLVVMALSCDRLVDFPAEETGKIYVNAIMTDTGDSRMQIAVSQPVGGTAGISGKNMEVSLTADGETVELTRESGTLSEGMLAYKTDARFSAGQELAFQASCDGLPSVHAKVVVPAEIPEIQIFKSETDSYRTDSPGQQIDGIRRLWQFHVRLDETPYEGSYIGVQVIRRKMYEYSGNVPEAEKDAMEKEAGVEEADDLYVRSVMEGNGEISSIATETVVYFDGGETAVTKAAWINAWVRPTEKTLVESAYSPVTGVNYAIYQYYEYRIKVYRFSPEMYSYIRARYVSDNSVLPSHLGFTPPTYTYTNIVGGIGVFGAVTAYESEWTRYE